MMPSNLDSVLNPISVARGLPNEHYISKDMYLQEREGIFFKGWAALAFESDVKSAGDAFPVDLLGMPLLVIKDKSGSINVFQNTCRHRGMMLLQEPTHLKGPVRCPYHSWCYSHQGKLVRTPYVGGVGIDEHEDINREELGLFPIRSHVWQGVIFVNVSGEAEDFEVVHKDLIQRWSEFDQPYYLGGEVSKFEMTLSTNWKLAVENYCEAYHLPWVHPELNEISPIDVHYNIENHDDYSGQGTSNYRQLIGKDGKKFPDFQEISNQWDTQGEYVSFFPNVLLGVHRDHAFAMLLMPQGPEITLERVALCYSEQNIDAPEWQPMLKENARIWQDVFSEDINAVEGMQKGRHGKFFDAGKFSPDMDGPTHIFHKWVAKKMLNSTY